MEMPKDRAPFFVDREVIILNRYGIWLADGIEITHEPTRRLFARSLKRDPSNKNYYLEVGREKKQIQVEDTPYFILRIDGDSSTGYELSLNDETREPLSGSKIRPCRLIRGFQATVSPR